MATWTKEINPADLNIFGQHQQGDKDFWGPPLFKVDVWLEAEKVLNSDGKEVEQLLVKVDGTWREPKPNWTRFQAINSQQVLTLDPGQRFVGLGNKVYKVSTQERPINGTNAGLVEIYNGDSNNNKLVETISAEGDKKGEEDTPNLAVSFRKGIEISITNE